MKASIFVNEVKNRYKSQFECGNHIDISLIEKVPEDYQIILRGEPTLHPEFSSILKMLKNRDYILTTDAENTDILLSYKGRIPYISFNYDGVMNDYLKNRSYLSFNIIRCLNHFNTKDTITRLNYTISPYIINWIYSDATILRNFLQQFPKMKKPYFNIYQKGELFSQDNFVWTSITEKPLIDSLNKLGILTQKNLNYLLSFARKQSYNCTSTQDEVVINYDGTIRNCMSHRFNEVLLDLNTRDFSELQLKDNSHCPMRDRCWISHHRKND